MMRAEQVIYTSCRRGRSGHPGFQIRASSVELPADDEKEILYRGDYKPPTSLPALPESDSGFHDYPIAFHFNRLPSGKVAVTRSVYAGRDGGGRPGNFLAHSLVLEGELPTDRWPVDLVEWEGWCGPLTPEARDSEEPPPSLPTIELETIPSAESFGWADLAEFVEEDPRRRPWLASMIEAVLLGPETSRPVLIRCPALDAAFWIACLQKTLPPELSTRIGFSTYQYAPRGCTDVNVTSGRTSFELDEADRRYRYFVFDWDEDIRSEVEGRWPGHGESVVSALCEEPERLAAFFDWARAFGSPTLGNLPLLWASHAWLSSGVEVGKRALPEWLELWSGADAESRHRIQEQLWQRLEMEVGTLPLPELEHLTRFFLDAVKASGLEIDRRRGVELWLRLLVRGLAGDGGAIASATGIWRRLAAAEPEVRAALAQQILEAEPWAIERSSEASEASCLLLEITVCAFRWGQEENPWHLDPVRLQIRALGETPRGRRRVLAAAVGDPSSLGLVIDDLSEVAEGSDDPRSSLRDLGAALTPIFEAIGEPTASKIRQRLEGGSRWEVLFGEWLAWLDAGRKTGSPKPRVRQYVKTILPQVPDFAESTRGWRAASLLEGVSEKEQWRQALDWLDSGELESLPKDLREIGLRLANEALPLHLTDSASDARSEKLGRLAAAAGSPPKPDRPYLRSTLSRAEEGRLDAETMRATSKAMADLPGDEVDVYLERLLPIACEGFSNLKDHERFLAHFHHHGQPKHFRKLYSRTLSGLRGRALVAALRFWLSGPNLHSGIEPLRRPARSSLEKGLVRMSEEDYDEVASRLAKSESTIRERWRTLESDLDRRRQGLIGKTVRWLGGLGRRDDSDSDEV